LAGEHADAELLFHVSADFTADIGIEQQEDVLEQFDDGDLDAEHGGHAGEFATDETAAHHDHGAGEFLDVKESAAFDDALMFRQEAGHGGSRAGGDDDLLRRKTGRAAGTGHVEGGAVDEAGGAGELFHAIGGEQRADAAAQLLNDLVLVADHGGVVGGGALDGDAEGFGVFDAVERVGGGDEGLGGDAAPVEAGAAELFLLDDGD